MIRRLGGIKHARFVSRSQRRSDANSFQWPTSAGIWGAIPATKSWLSVQRSRAGSAGKSAKCTKKKGASFIPPFLSTSQKKWEDSAAQEMIQDDREIILQHRH
jgi:hypothetical protein